MEFVLNTLSYFILYSMIGWGAELVWRSIIEEKKIVKEAGFLRGPWCPIYGVGALIIIYWLNGYKDDIFGLFIMSTVACTILEYVTSYIMERIFGKRWWDYSEYKFNLNGRICLLNSVAFGLSAVLLIGFLHPLVVYLIDLIPTTLHVILTLIFVLFFLYDFIMTLISMLHLKNIFTALNNNFRKRLLLRKNTKKLTEQEFKKKPKVISINTLHLLKRFPNLINSNRKEIKKALNSVIDEEEKESNKK